jgi:hypothetical protein
MQTLTAFIGSSTWYWNNPEIIAHLKDLMAIEPEEIQKYLDDNVAAVHVFVRQTYVRIYGSSVRSYL